MLRCCHAILISRNNGEALLNRPDRAGLYSEMRGGFELFAASKLCEPIFQDLLLRGLNVHKLDSHPR